MSTSTCVSEFILSMKIFGDFIHTVMLFSCYYELLRLFNSMALGLYEIMLLLCTVVHYVIIRFYFVHTPFVLDSYKEICLLLKAELLCI